MVEVGENVERNAGGQERPEIKPADAAPRDAEQASSPAEEPEKKSGGGVLGFVREIAILVALALVLTFVTQTFLGRVYKIPSGSMEKTLHGCEVDCVGDRVLVDKITYNFRDIRPGDVVVFTRPPGWGGSDTQPNMVAAWWRDLRSGLGLGPEDRETLIKRVIAVGGQTVQCCDPEGRVVVDGKPLDEPYVYLRGGSPVKAEFGPVTVPEGHVWVMGDSRNNSADSRFHTPGFVPVDHVVGKARLILWPYDRWALIDSHNPQG